MKNLKIFYIIDKYACQNYKVLLLHFLKINNLTLLNVLFVKTKSFKISNKIRKKHKPNSAVPFKNIDFLKTNDEKL